MIARVVLLLLLVTPGARADEQIGQVVEKARAHFRAGDAFYQAGLYADALREFEAGYELAPRSEFLINLGQSQRKLHHKRQAIDMFEKFLASVPSDDPRRPEVASVLADLRNEPDEAPAPAPPPAIVELAPHPPAPHRERVGPALLGVGASVAVAGIALVAYAVPTLSHAGRNLESFDAARSAVDLRAAGATLVGVGGALLIGGVVRYVTRRH